MMNYNHLNKHERDKLSVLRGQGLKFREIAEKLGRSPGTLSRELKRNNSRIAYFPHKAQEKAEKRHRECHRKKRLKTYALRFDVEKMLINGWSPEIIAGQLKRLNGDKRVISHESIYQWIYKEAPYLTGYLVRSREKRYPRNYKRGKRIKIPNRIPIKERPIEVSGRKEPGHWESDLITSVKSKPALQVDAERASRYVRLSKVKDKTAVENKEAICFALKDYPAHVKRSITYDNGSENTEHEAVNARLGTRSYFCEPYHSWEKGTVENTNGLIRRFFPKGTDFAKISDERIKEVETWLNNRPRKCLGFKTPAEVFNAFVALTP